MTPERGLITVDEGDHETTERAPAPERLKADVIGIEILPDGRVVAVGLQGGRQRRPGRPDSFVRVAGSPEQLAEWLGDGRLACDRINLCLPAHIFVAKRLELPSTDPDEVASMVGYEVQGLVPFAEGEAEHAFVPGGTTDAGYTCVTTFLAPASALDSAVAPLKDAGLSLDRLIVSPVALAAWARVMRGYGAAASDAAVIVADDPTGVQTVALQGAGLVCWRATRLAADVTSDRGRMDAAVADAADAAGHLGGPSPCLLFAVPDGAGDLLRSRLAEQGVEVSLAKVPDDAGQVAPELCLGAEEAAVPESAIARAYGAAAVGLVPEFAGFNLLPESLRAVRRRRSLLRALAATAILALTLVGLVVALVQVQVHRQTRRIRALRAEIAPIKHAALAVEEKRQQLKMLTAQASERALPLVALAELHEHTPGGVHISELKVKGNTVEITGQAEVPEDAYTYPSILAQSEAYEWVSLRGTHPVKRGGGVVTEFACTCRVVVPDIVEQGAGP